MAERGKYIVIEGTDGTGKSTQADLLTDRLRENGTQIIHIKEPGGAPIAEEIRKVILNSTLIRTPMTNILLFTANRHELWENTILPALESGTWVVCTRNYWSTIAYQGFGEGADVAVITAITRTFTSVKYTQPDYSVILDVDNVSERQERIAARGILQHPDTFESKDDSFQRRVIEGYRAIAAENNIPVLSAIGTPEDIHEKIWAIIQQ